MISFDITCGQPPTKALAKFGRTVKCCAFDRYCSVVIGLTISYPPADVGYALSLLACLVFTSKFTFFIKCIGRADKATNAQTSPMLDVGCNTVANTHDMKISTWNLMRPTQRTVSRNTIFRDTIKKANPDILILTETNSCIHPGADYFSISTKELPKNFEGFSYSDGENRATIYSKFPFGKSYTTTDEYTCICSEILLPNRNLIIYATIIGITGGLDTRFQEDFEKQIEDLRKFSSHNNICVVGDFNISFSGRVYPSKKIQIQAKEYFKEIQIDILTKEIQNSPDHIGISKAFLNESLFEYSEITFEKKVTDHSFITVSLPL